MPNAKAGLCSRHQSFSAGFPIKVGGRLVIALEGPEMKWLKKRLGKNVEFLGEFDERQLRKLYAQCRIAVQSFALIKPVRATSANSVSR